MLLGVTSATGAAEQELVLQERLKRQWTNELVTFSFEAAEGQCHRDSVRLVGPRGPVPVQASEVTFWPGSAVFVRTARLSFVVDLTPLAKDTYTVQFGVKAAETEQPATDLTVTREEGAAEFATSGFGVRLLEGAKQYDEPVSSEEVPGPVVDMRMGVRSGTPQASGARFGGSRMFGPGKISAWSAEVTDNGPVFARAVIRYTYADGNTLDLTVQVVAGSQRQVDAVADAHVAPEPRNRPRHVGLDILRDVFHPVVAHALLGRRQRCFIQDDGCHWPPIARG